MRISMRVMDSLVALIMEIWLKIATKETVPHLSNSRLSASFLNSGPIIQVARFFEVACHPDNQEE